MIQAQGSSAVTRSLGAGKVAVFVAAAISSTTPMTPLANDPLDRCRFDHGELARTAEVDLSRFTCDSASTEPRALTHKEATAALAKFLADEGFKATRLDYTSDQTALFQFLGRTKACVDLYPNGDLIVVIRQKGQDEVHELQYGDANLAIQLLRDAGVIS